MSEKTLRVLLVDDNPADTDSITESLFRSGMPVVAERVNSRATFTQALRDFAPDVVLADRVLADFDAISALNVLHAVRPTKPLIVMADALNDESAAAYVRAGAEDVVLKSNLSRLAPTIEMAVSVRLPLERLTVRQMEVLRLMAAGLSTPEIARKLDLSSKTVETHRSEIMKRVGIHDIVGLVRYAMRVGLVSPEP